MIENQSNPESIRANARRKLRRSLDKALYWSGASAVYRVARARPGAMILMYHSVPDSAQEQWIDPRNFVPEKVFAEQMRFLARRRRVIGMTELVDALDRGETSAAGSVVITFDDGYRDNLQIAEKILAHYELPATFYLATGYVTRGETQWSDRLYCMFSFRSRDVLVLDAPTPRTFDLRNPEDARQGYRLTADRLLRESWGNRESLLSDVESQLRPNQSPPRLTLNWEEVGDLARRHPRFEVGVHTRDHVDVVEHEDDAAIQVESSLEDVQREIGRRAEHFSFPYGRANEKTRRLVARLGLHSAVVTEPTDLVRHDSDRFALPRVEVPRSMTLFRYWTSGAHPGLSRALLGRA